MESSNEDVELLRPKAADVARWPRPWAALSLAFAGAGCLALALRPMLRAGQEPRELLANSQTGFYSSGGDLVKHFQIQQDRVPVAVIDFIWPGLNVEFQEGEGTVTAQSLSDYTFALLGEAPFGTKGEVRVPAGGCCSDQLNWGEYVAYTRKQVCYLAALVAAGNEAADYDSGLSRLIPPDKCDHDEYEAGFKRSLLGLLAACSVDPTLKEGQGPVLIVAKSTDGHDPSKPSPALDSDVKLEEGSLRTCRFRDGSSGNPAKNGMAVTEPSACSEEPPVDFMRAGNKLQGQVMVDITAAWIGGYILAHKGCGGVDGGQDERLMTTMPEVMVLSFFMSAKASPLASEGVALLVPAYIIGARRIFAGFDGTSRDIGPGNFNAGKPAVNLAAPMTSDLASVELHGGAAQISATSPFLGFQSINQQSGLASDVPTARLNQNPIQFEMDGDYGFPEQVKAWYNAVALTHWHPDVQGVLRTLAVSIGSGPWGSGVWWGNSQIFFLVAWMGQALSSSSWGEKPPPLDFYIYSSFTENPSNQCLIHAYDDCVQCLNACEDAYAGPGRNQRYCCMEPEPWIPSAGLFPPAADGKACIPSDMAAKICGTKGYGDVYEHFKDKTVGELWAAVKTAATSLDPKAKTLFDAMLL